MVDDGPDAPVYAAVAWDESGFSIASVGSADDTLQHAAAVADVARHLDELRRRVGDRLVCVVDSTDGMLDGGLMSAGHTVTRADPGMLPPRPALGSVGALQLARAAAARPEQLAPLQLATGSLTGRLARVEQLLAETAGGLDDLRAGGRCVSAGSGDDRTVALTFDDGPHPPYTDRVLDVLADHGVPATFFCVGLHARTHRDLIRRIGDEGHRLGNHTYSHALLADLDAEQLRAQLDRTDELLSPDTSRLLFRPPYGAVDPNFVRRFAADPAARSMVLWDVEAYDWALPGADTIADATLDAVVPGSIVLLHDGGGDRSQTVQALPRIVATLLERGYRFVTVDAMFSSPSTGGAGRG